MVTTPNENKYQVERALVCTCDGLEKVIEQGIDSMRKEGAPRFAISDFANEMQMGDWIHCTCSVATSVKDTQRIKGK